MKKNAQNEKKNIKTVIENNKKPIIIGAICTGAVALAAGLGKAFSDMKKSAKAQHEVDKANFAAAKAEAKANFEENRFHNTYAKAKRDAKKVWDDAHMSPSERAEKMQEERDEQLAQAQQRIEEANARYEAAKK